MITTLSKLVSDGLFEPLDLITTIKPSNPVSGDIYHDTNKKRNYFFDGTNWKELLLNSKDGEFNKKRMRKINNIFNEIKE
jgi:hypothetical protein